MGKSGHILHDIGAVDRNEEYEESPGTINSPTIIADPRFIVETTP